MFPTAIEMPEDVVWRRDIYRELDLNRDNNAGLYYPVEPIDKQVNLFTYIFKLALNDYIPVYEYRLDGNEVFTDSARVKMKTVLDNYHIFYEEKDGKLRVDNSDIPSAEVKLYYLKESAYYDQANSSFHRKVLAICPVMMREDDFGGEASKYPLFWVKYADLEPFLSRQTLMTSNLNNAAMERFTRPTTCWARLWRNIVLPIRHLPRSRRRLRPSCWLSNRTSSVTSIVRTLSTP